MIRICLAALAALAASLPAPPARAADLHAPPSTSRFLATCEDLGRFCAAEACGGDQIEAALGCRALCPASVVLAVVPVACPLPAPRVVLRRRG